MSTTFEPICENELVIIAENEIEISHFQSQLLEEAFPCDCIYNDQVRDPESQACGIRSGCINRTLQIECDPMECPCRRHCRNQRFQNRQYAEVEIFETSYKGRGLRAKQDLPPGTFVIEYVGEVVDKDQLSERAELYSRQGIQHHYFMALHNNLFIDATRKGNLSRFINHSCNPNCQTEKWIAGRQLHVGIFSKKHIKAGTELVFDYQFVAFDTEPQRCFCGESNCKGTIGKSATRIPRISEDSNSRQTVFNDSNYAFDSERPTDELEVSGLLKSLLSAQTPKVISEHLDLLNRIEDTLILRKFVLFHGLRILGLIIQAYSSDEKIICGCLEFLLKLIIPNRNILDESKIEAHIRNLQEVSISEDCSLLVEKLLEKWHSLGFIPRISKACERKKETQQKAMPELSESPQIKYCQFKGSNLDSVGYSLVDEPIFMVKDRSEPISNHGFYKKRKSSQLDRIVDQNAEGYDKWATYSGTYLKGKEKIIAWETKNDTKTKSSETKLKEIISRARSNAFSSLTDDPSTKVIDLKIGQKRVLDEPNKTSSKKQLFCTVLELTEQFLEQLWERKNLPPPWPTDLAKNLARGLVEKELRVLNKPEIPVSKSSKIDIDPRKELKMKNFIRQYLQRHGYLENKD